MKTKEQLVTFHTLGLEELALTLGILNRGDVGRTVIRSVYNEITDDQIEERLTAASHSLLARGYVFLSEEGKPELEGELEAALFPLIRFDRLLQMSTVSSDDQTAASIHIQKGRSFTSHSVQADVVHVIEHGETMALIDHILDGLREIAEGGMESVEIPAAIKPSILGKAVSDAEPQKIEKTLVEQGWPSKHAKELAADLCGQIARSTILLNEVEDDQALPETGRMMWFLQGKERNWLFKFDSTDDQVSGSAYLVTHADIVKHLRDFLS